MKTVSDSKASGGGKLQKILAWSINQAAAEFGVSRETVRRGLRRADLPAKDSYTTREIVTAIFGDKDAAKLRILQAQARQEEVSATIAERDAMPTADVEALFNRIMAMVRQQFLAAPSLAPQVNPSDPTHARAHLERFTDNALKTCRDFEITDK